MSAYTRNCRMTIEIGGVEQVIEAPLTELRENGAVIMGELDVTEVLNEDLREEACAMLWEDKFAARDDVRDTERSLMLEGLL